ncbi:MAG TPA: HD domain-containing protein [Geminicoccaceae bacterium]|nr:HD domain-containing protein [Geminicoccaceae bacterium]
MPAADMTPKLETVIDMIADLFRRRGAEAYLGEEVTQAEHMLQAAALAAAEDGSDAMIAAALLHDVGHLVSDAGDDYIERGVDNRHEEAAARFLAPFFPPEVVEPIRLHVATKRYLCAVDPDYRARLSEASVRTLALQGGPMDPAEAEAFARDPHRDQAVKVRLWDEAAKEKGRPTPPFDHWRPVLERLVAAGAGAGGSAADAR